MRKRTRTLSATLALGLAASLSVGSVALAGTEVRVPVDGAPDAYLAITSVVAAYPEEFYYEAEAPVTVTFHGDNLSWEDIEYLGEGYVEDGFVYLPDSGDTVRFAVKNYTYYEEAQVHDELTEEPMDEVFYVSGNYAVLTTPGYYSVVAAPLAVAPTRVIIQVRSSSAESGHTGQAASEPAAESPPESVVASPTTARVLVDGKEVAFEAYTIDGYNYFKLRDLAMALNESEKQFQVTWDGEFNAINLVSGHPYTAVGGELTVSTDPEARQAVPTASKVFVNGRQVDLTAYNIGGYNYFKLRDVAKAMDFGVTWHQATSTIGIDTTSGYSE